MIQKRTVACLLLGLAVFVVAGFSSAPRTAYAVEFVVDLSDIPFDVIGAIQQFAGTLLQGEDFTKEYVLDPLAWVAKSAVLQNMSQSILNWTGSGFSGSPAFVTNLRDHLRSINDEVAEDFLEQLATSGSIESPFRTDVADALRQNFFRSTGENSFADTVQYDLPEECSTEGNFQCWIQRWSNPANNPFGLYQLAETELTRRTSETETNRRQEIDWGRGFFSQCDSDSNDQTAGETEGTESVTLTESPASPANCSISFPGALGEALNAKVLGVPIDTLISADEISEVLIGFLQNMALSALQNGLTGDNSSEGRGGVANPDADAGVISAFLQTIDRQKSRVAEYRTAWQNIQEIAQEANELCGSRTTPDAELVNEVLARAAVALAKAETALAALEDITTRAQAATTSIQVEEVSTDYRALLDPTNEVLPGPEEIVDAVVQSTDTQGVEPASLYTQMKEIKEDRCGAGTI